MKNNLLTTNPEEIAKLYLQPLVSNVDGLTVYGGKRLTEPITIFIKGAGIKLDNYLYELEQLGNVYNPDRLDYTNECEFSVYNGRNLTVNNVDKVTVNNIPIKKIIEDKLYWNYPYVFDNLENWYCVLIYGILDEGEENGEHYIWNKLNDIFSSNTTVFDVISIPSQSIVILPKLLEQMPTGRSRKDLRLLDGYYSVSEAASIILEFEEIYATELEVISHYGESQGSHLWNCLQYCKQNFNEDTHEPIVYITSDTLPTLSDTYCLNNVKVRFLNPSVAKEAIFTQYWLSLNIEYDFVEGLMLEQTSDTIVAYYQITTIGNTGIIQMIDGVSEMYVDGELQTPSTSYTFNTTGIHKVEFVLNPSYTIVPNLFLYLGNLYAVCMPTLVSGFSRVNPFGGSQGGKLKYVLLSITSRLPDDAFMYCTDLNLIVTTDTPPTMDGTSFLEATIQNIYVPASAVNTYKTATGWSTYADQIKAIPE